MMYLIKTNKAFNKDFILYSIVLLSLFFIALTTLNAQSKPDAPTIELVQVQATHTTVQWNPVTDATFYYIFVCNETNQCNIGILYDANHNQKTTPYLQTITPLTPNTSYSITITAYANNQWSDYSNWIHIKTKKEDTIPLTQQSNQQGTPQTPQQPQVPTNQQDGQPQQVQPTPQPTPPPPPVQQGVPQNNQQDNQQGVQQQNNPQQENVLPMCRWISPSGILERFDWSCEGETSVLTLPRFSRVRCDNINFYTYKACTGTCQDGGGNARNTGYEYRNTGNTQRWVKNCSATNQLCVPDGRRCIDSQGVCAWRDAEDITKRTCLEGDTKRYLQEQKTKQVCRSASGSNLCSGTCWGLNEKQDGAENKPRGSVRYVIKQPREEHTTIGSCGISQKCTNGNCIDVPRTRIAGQCYYGEWYQRCAGTYFDGHCNNWRNGCWRECYDIYNDGTRESASSGWINENPRNRCSPPSP